MQRNRSYGGRPASRPPQRAGIQIQPRFFVFLLFLVLVIAVASFVANGGIRSAGGGSGSAVVRRAADIGSQFQGEVVIVRDEVLFDEETYSRIDFRVQEGAQILSGDVICNVYTSSYNQSDIRTLNNTRSKIKLYHRTQLEQVFNDTQLEDLNRSIEDLAWEVRLLVQGSGSGSLSNLERQLSDALQARQLYLRRKYPGDQTLIQLYKEEESQLRNINNWMRPSVAVQDGIVSFYTDGYERRVNGKTFNDLTIAQTRSVLAGQSIETDLVARGRQPIYRIVVPGHWYILVLSADRNWHPIEGARYKVKLEGYEGFLVDAVVRSSTIAGGDTLVRMDVDADVRPVLNIRSCRAAVGESISGLVVPTSALHSMGQYPQGVTLADGSGAYVPVQLLSTDGQNAYVQPTIEGTLQDGQRVLTY